MSKLADIAGDIAYLRQDNTGENLKLAKRMGCADWKMKPKVEYTARGTPQQNHMAELGFTAIVPRSTAAMNRANFPLEVRYTTFCEVSNCIAKLDWLTVIELDGEKKTRIEHYQENYWRSWDSAHLKEWQSQGQRGHNAIHWVCYTA